MSGRNQNGGNREQQSTCTQREPQWSRSLARWLGKRLAENPDDRERCRSPAERGQAHQVQGHAGIVGSIAPVEARQGNPTSGEVEAQMSPTAAKRPEDAACRARRGGAASRPFVNGAAPRSRPQPTMLTVIAGPISVRCDLCAMSNVRSDRGSRARTANVTMNAHREEVRAAGPRPRSGVAVSTATRPPCEQWNSVASTSLEAPATSTGPRPASG